MPADSPDDAPVRPRIYLLHLRQFTNLCETRRPNGTLAENGVGHFKDLTPLALQALRNLGITHLWLLGVPRQATGTDHSHIGLPADDPDLLKGIAGSPYAIRDAFDVCPDYATDPARRREEFRELVGRIHAAGLRVLIDFVPNHVARSHRSVVRPDLDLGLSDDITRFFSPSNHFFHLPGQGPLQLPTVRDGAAVSPTCQVLGGCDGSFAPESVQARVTGNNVTSPRPSIHDWYETVKLNYGLDFTLGQQAPRHFPTPLDPTHPVPDTWLRMDAVLAHWQDFGVDGFRCDMAHWIPTEFWSWAVSRARTRRPGACFVAEAYDDDPNKVCDGSTLEALVSAGFDAVYDHAAYRILKDIQDGPKWANDLTPSFSDPTAFQHSLRYVENHDEVRIAHHGSWGGHGARIGLASAAVQFGTGAGPVLVYGGQEVAEPAEHPEGFGGGSGRTSLFDYGSMPQVARWVNGHRFDGGQLDAEQRRLREGYQRLLSALDHPALRSGNFHPLNPSNINNPDFGRTPGDPASGHWIYAWIRHDPISGATILAVVNLHGCHASTPIRIRLPADVLPLLGHPPSRSFWSNLLAPAQPVEVFAEADSILLPPIPPATALFLEPRRSPWFQDSSLELKTSSPSPVRLTPSPRRQLRK